LEELLRQINPLLSLHYWNWTQDPRAIPNANLGGGVVGTLNLFTAGFMGYGGSSLALIDQPWLSAGYYVPGATPHRDATGNPADPPRAVNRFVAGSPASATQDQAIVAAGDYVTMRNLLEAVDNAMHGFVFMGGTHISFRDPFVFLLHSNVDRLFALCRSSQAFRSGWIRTSFTVRRAVIPVSTATSSLGRRATRSISSGLSTSRGRGMRPRVRASQRLISIP
jgi:hypothetical protein